MYLFLEQSRAIDLHQSQPFCTYMLHLASIFLLLFFLNPQIVHDYFLFGQYLFTLIHMLSIVFARHSFFDPKPSFPESDSLYVEYLSLMIL